MGSIPLAWRLALADDPHRQLDVTSVFTWPSLRVFVSPCGHLLVRTAVTLIFFISHLWHFNYNVSLCGPFWVPLVWGSPYSPDEDVCFLPPVRKVHSRYFSPGGLPAAGLRFAVGSHILCPHLFHPFFWRQASKQAQLPSACSLHFWLCTFTPACLNCSLMPDEV